MQINANVWVIVLLFFQRTVWHRSDSNSGALVQHVSLQTVRLGTINGQTAAVSCLSLCASLWHLCTADCFL